MVFGFQGIFFITLYNLYIKECKKNIGSGLPRFRSFSASDGLGSKKFPDLLVPLSLRSTNNRGTHLVARTTPLSQNHVLLRASYVPRDHTGGRVKTVAREIATPSLTRMCANRCVLIRRATRPCNHTPLAPPSIFHPIKSHLQKFHL
jgi:hypothetical protein